MEPHTLPKRVASEPRMVYGREQRRSLLTEALPSSAGRLRGGENPAAADSSSHARSAEDVDQSIVELRRILQSGAALGSPASSFFGVSPPQRCNDGLVQDKMWQRNFHKGSRSNLQALREMDQTGGTPFLRGGAACGDPRLILGSPEFSFLASYGAERSRSGPISCSAAAGRTPSPAPCDIDVLGWA